MANEYEAISFFMHCGKCLGELPEGMSPKGYAQQQIGITDDGYAIIWCNRHDCFIGKLQLSEPEKDQLKTCSCSECNAKGVVNH